MSDAVNGGSEQLASLLDARASTVIDVVYHGSPPPEPAPQTTGSSEPPSDACALITDAEVVEILGVALARHEVFDDGTFQTCVKGTARQPLDGMAMSDVSYVQVAVGTGSLAMMHDGEDDGPTTPLDDLGDAAEIIDGAGAVIFDSGPLVILVQVVQAGSPASTDVVLAVARLVLGRLP